MTAYQPLPLYEEILLLALDDEKGTTPTGDWFVTAMGGAILAELVLQGALHLADDSKKTASPAPDARSADPLLSEALEMVKSARRPKAASGWVMRFAHLPRLKNRAARQLVAKGILREEVGTVLKVFKRPLFPERDTGPEEELMARLETAIFSDTAEVSQRTIIVLALTHAVGLLDRVFDKKRLRQRDERLRELTTGQIVGNATAEAVAAIQAAIFVCTMVPVITESTTR